MGRRLAILAGCAMVLVAAAWFFIPSTPDVCALVRVQRNPPGVLNKTAESQENFNIFKRTQVQLILSPLVLERTASEPSISKLSAARDQRQTVAWLKRQLIIDFPDDAELMRIRMKGQNVAELKKVIDAVVEQYMKEVVYTEKQKKVDQEAKLAKSYEDYTKDVEKQMKMVHALETLHKVSSSESAAVNKRIAADRLQEALDLRKDIKRKLLENAVEIDLEKAREEHGVKTAELEAVANDASAKPPLWLLDKKQAILESRLAKSDEEIDVAAAAVANLESFSAEVASKQEELRRLKGVTNELGTQLDRIRVERMALDRISPLYKATVGSDEADRTWPNVGFALLGACGVGLIAAGIISRRSPGAPAA